MSPNVRRLQTEWEVSPSWYAKTRIESSVVLGSICHIGITFSTRDHFQYTRPLVILVWRNLKWENWWWLWPVVGKSIVCLASSRYLRWCHWEVLYASGGSTMLSGTCCMYLYLDVATMRVEGNEIGIACHLLGWITSAYQVFLESQEHNIELPQIDCWKMVKN